MLKKHLLVTGLLFFLLLFICRLAYPKIIRTPAQKVVENIRHKGIEKAYFITYRKTMSEMDHSGDKKIDITENREQILNALNDCEFFPLDLASSCEAEGKFQILSGGEEIEIWYSCAGFKIDKPLAIGEFSCSSLMRFANGLLIDEKLRVFSQEDFKKAALEFAAKGNEIALMSLPEWQIKEGIPLIFEKLSMGAKKKTFWLAELSRFKDIQNQDWIKKVIPFLKSNDPNSVLRAADILNNWGQRRRLNDLAQNKEYVSLTLISWLSQKRDDKTAEKAIALLMPEKCKIKDAYILLGVSSKTAYLKLADIIEYHGNELYLNLVTDTADSMGMEYDFIRKKFVPKGAATDGGWNIKEVRLQSKIIAEGLRNWAEKKWP